MPESQPAGPPPPLENETLSQYCDRVISGWTFEQRVSAVFGESDPITQAVHSGGTFVARSTIAWVPEAR